MLTKEQVLEWLKTEEGKVLEKELNNSYMQNNPEAKALLDEAMKPEIDKAKTEAIKAWEETGKGGKLKKHNEKLLDEVKNLKESAENGKKLNNLLETSGFSSYNLLEEAVLSIRDTTKDVNEEIVNLKKELNSYRIKSRDLEAKLPALETERDTLTTAVQDSDSYISQLLISKGIKSALIGQNFDENQAKGLVHRISELGNFKVEINEESGDRKAVNDYGMSPEDYTVKEYLASEEGKAFKPNKASGGGAMGDLLGGGGKSKTWKDMTWSERQEMSIKDPESYLKLKQASKPKTN